MTGFTSAVSKANLNFFSSFNSLLTVMLESMITRIIVLNIFLDRFLECLFTVFIATPMSLGQGAGARGLVTQG